MSEYPQEQLLENAKASGDPERPLALLEEVGYAAKLQKLQGSLKKHEGTFVYPKKLKPGQYEVKITDTGGKQMAIVIPGKSLDVVVDFEKLEELATANTKKGAKGSGNHFAGHNRGNVKITVDNLCAQVKKAIKKATKEKGKDGKQVSVAEIFKRFDENGNGVLDQREFLNGCHMLKVQISKEEVKLVWPVLTMGTTEEVSTEKFLKFVSSTSTDGRRSSAAREAGRTREGKPSDSFPAPGYRN